MKEKIKVKFCIFDYAFDYKKLSLYRILAKKYDVEISENPDFLFYGCFNNDFMKYDNCVKIFYVQEPIVPNFNDCDYAIGTDYMNFGDRYLRYPEYYDVLFENKDVRKNISNDLAKRKFCNFIYSNAKYGRGAKIRQEFCQKLMQYKPVDCPGTVLNNMKNAIIPREGIWAAGKLDFIKNYKFTIGFENVMTKGYTTEKLTHPFVADTIPIYWGNPRVVEEFNPKAFINCNDYKNFDEVIEKVIELDKNDDLYLKMLKEPVLQDDRILHYEQDLENFLYNIIEKGNNPFDKNFRNFGDTKYNIKLFGLKIKFKYLAKFIKKQK